MWLDTLQQKLVGNSGWWQENLASLKDIIDHSLPTNSGSYARSQKSWSGFMAGTVKVLLIMIVIIIEEHLDDIYVSWY